MKNHRLPAPEELVEPDEVRVPDVGDGAKLALEAEEELAFRNAEHLEGDRLVAFLVPRRPHDPHRPRAELPR